eukprot:536226_1
MSDPKARLRRERSQKLFDKSFLRDDHLSHQSIFERINWLNCTIVFGIPLIALYGVCTIREFVWQTWAWSFVYYLWCGLGVTAGYHRYWSHNSYSCSWFLQIFLMFGGTGALQGSIKWWSLLHRAHHRYTDTESDPYNSMRGFFYAHVGWLLLDNIRVDAHVDVEDLRSNKMVRWQHNNYHWFGPFMALILPTLIGYWFCGDIRGGFYIIGALRLLFVHHATWCINSVAHYWGTATFDDTISPKDSILTGLLTLGEGYHNFHHEFPHDYRNGIHWWDYDPTKWFINLFSHFGVTYDLNKFPENEIIKGELDMIEKDLMLQKSKINYGVDIDTLPIWTKEEFEKENKNGKGKRILIIVSDIVYDCTDFVKNNKHPGGRSIIIQRKGKDVTQDFNGTVYNHTNAARNLMSHLRIAKKK